MSDELNELKGMVESLTERVAELESENAELAERVAELESENERLQDRVETLENVVLGEYGRLIAETNAENEGGVLDRLDDVERDLDRGAGAAGSDGDDDGGDGAADEDKCPMQQIAELPDDVAEKALENVDQRARVLWRQWDAISEKTPTGSIIKSRDAIKALQQFENEHRDIPANINSELVKRAFLRVQTLTGGVVQRIKKRGHWRLKRPDGWRDMVAEKDVDVEQDAPHAAMSPA